MMKFDSVYFMREIVTSKFSAYNLVVSGFYLLLNPTDNDRYHLRQSYHNVTKYTTI